MSTSTRPRPARHDATAAAAQVEIVLEGGAALGFGHAGRCLALWEELGERAAFLVEDEAVGEFLRRRGASFAGPASRAPVVVLDRAAPVAVAEVLELQRKGRRAVLIDDLGPARMHADLLVDPPTAASWPAAAGRRLGGFEHALLRREVREGHSSAGPLAARGGGVLLALGGSDPAGLTPLLARELCAAGLDVTVALGPGYRGMSPTSGSLLDSPDRFVAALAGAELLVTGYGHSLLEAAHLGVPAIAVVHRPEQLEHARAFCAHRTAALVDFTTPGQGSRLAALAAELLGSADLRAAMSTRGRELVDGLGARRVARALMELA